MNKEYWLDRLYRTYDEHKQSVLSYREIKVGRKYLLFAINPGENLNEVELPYPSCFVVTCDRITSSSLLRIYKFTSKRRKPVYLYCSEYNSRWFCKAVV